MDLIFFLAEFQAFVAAAASHTAEIFGLNQSLEWAKEELGQLKMQLRDKQGVVTEVEALKKAVAEAEEKAATEQALREKHEARVIKAEKELQEAVRKCETLEQSLTEKESELTLAHQATSDARGEPKAPCRGSKRRERSRRGYLPSYPAAYQMPPNSTEPKKGTL
ncbi:uncharacterized protein [Aegilops tauschii subsp. strangulata]|uniref:uncharacterized protein isoform X3 n=1 Tax=Aegilops tauschii subsp. strangulata TaxID=200361 RepID=UPI003CC8C60B